MGCAERTAEMGQIAADSPAMQLSLRNLASAGMVLKGQDVSRSGIP